MGVQTSRHIFELKASPSPFVPAEAEFGGSGPDGILKIVSKLTQSANDFTVEVLNTAQSKGDETITWLPGGVSISVKTGSGGTDVDDILTAVATPAKNINPHYKWGLITDVAAGNTLVPAVPKTVIRNLFKFVPSNYPYDVRFADLSDLGASFNKGIVVFSKLIKGLGATFNVEASNNGFLGVYQEGSIGSLRLKLKFPGNKGFYTVTITDSVSMGNETQVWTPQAVVFAVEAGVSKVDDILLAKGGITGTPWAELSVTGLNGGVQTVSAKTATPLDGLEKVKKGQPAGFIVGPDISILQENGKNSTLIPIAANHLRLVGSATHDAQVEASFVGQAS